jgi:hypothetical protein
MAAEWSLLGRDVEHAREVLAGVPTDLRSGPLAVRLQCEAVRAQLSFMDGDRREGLAAVRRGERVLATHRAGLGSVDAVAASAIHGLRLQLLDLRAAMRTQRPDAVFDALERGRATFSGSGRVRPPDDPRIARLLVSARREIEAARLLGPTTGEELLERQRHLREARRLQEQARARSWHVEGERRPPEPVTSRRLRAALRSPAAGQTVVVSLGMFDDHVVAVRTEGSSQSLHRLVPLADVVERVQRARADFDVLANSFIPAPLRAAARASLQRGLRWLDDALLAPLDVEGDLHLAVRGMLLTVAWSALPSRQGRRTWVNSWVDLRSPVVGERSVDALVVVGPGLDSSVAEADLVSAAWERSTVLKDGDATCAATLEHLRSADVVHLAAHGTHEPGNPLFSSLRLADGPLFAHELDGVDLTGTTVVLSACEVGLSTADTGGEALGLASILLRHGARAVIAAVAPLRDDVAARVMPTLHAGLRAGAPPGQALAAAVAQEEEPVPLVCFGPLVL